MRVLVVGSGGREHAIVTSVANSPRVDQIYCAPGNAGIAALAECVPIGAMEFDKLVAFAKKHRIDFTIVGMDDRAGRRNRGCIRGGGTESIWPAQKCCDFGGLEGVFQGSDEEIQHSYGCL